MPQYFDVSRDTRPTHTKRRTFGRAGIVLHSTEGHNSLDWLQGNDPSQEKPASADFLLPHNGDCLQLCPIGNYTFHVGQGEWHGLSNVTGLLNQLLIGIEMESHETDSPRYTDLQLITCAALVRRLMLQWMIGILNTEYHRFIALPPGRRHDPVNFPLYVWSKELLAPSQLDSAFVWPERLP